MLTVTDDDTIERSNLSRQFLFRDKDIGGAKSEIAAAAAAKLNPHLRVQALQNRVGLETENLFNHPFWDNLTIVVNALDNVSARLYVDTRCVYHRKPLLESGTLGPKCNTQVVIPDMTENYGASRDPPERQAPMCTVHSFPHNIDHCLAWARSEFEGMLEQAPSEANAFLSNPEEVAKKLLEAADGASRQQLERVVEVLLDNRCSSFEDCVAWARLRFEDYFRSKILQLIHTFPEDAVTSTGLPFWSAPKRFPKALVFDSEDEVHASLVAAAARLKAQVHGVELPAWAMQDDVKIAQLALAVPVAEFVPKIGERIETDPKATAADAAAAGGGGQDDQALIENLLARLHAALANGVISAAQPLTAIQFEKDDDTNHHMAMIAGLANMRARCYGIAEVDRLKAKLIAGRIIPAIATATACATGLVCLELYKVLQGDKPIEAYRNSFVNLALPLMAMAEPMKMAVTKHGETLKWTLWDRWILKGDVTVQEVIDWLEEKGIIAGSISAGTALLYCNIFPRHADRVGKRVSELIETVGKVQLPKGKDVVDIIVACEDEEGNDVDVPQISIHFRNV
uniref:Ubiquitin-activating enzyme E1 C-terminal domain-containing protein n=1 Tax=Polytomella parva TaxID=51329 RepID=A0A7S0Y9F7_9CHLO|mmetsp:Transcript_10949/g.19920  ORF Transcript_10949/g.19920 Transcript_10949/m.19920 type:complete len:570 (+) Transcript_10949:195-1904(+)